MKSKFCCPFNGNQANAKVGLRYSGYLTNSQIENACESETENISGDLSRDFAYRECVKREKDKRIGAATDTLSTAWDWLRKPKDPVVGPAGSPPPEKSGFPWGTVLGIGGTLAVAVGVFYYYNKSKGEAKK